MKHRSNEISPTVPTGVPRMQNYILSGFVFLTVTYAAVVYFLRDSASFLTPAEEFCTDKHEKNNAGDCSRPDLFAFQFGSGLAIVFCGITGFSAWHISKRAHSALPNTPEGRLFGYLLESEKLAAANFTFQFWDFFVSLLIEEHCTTIMMIHHLMAALVSWCSLDNQYLHYYGVFFLGLSEFSSIFLVFVDVAKFFPPTPGTYYDTWVNMVCGPLFVVTFFYYRVFLWWKVSYLLWSDALTVLRNGVAEKLRPGRSYVLYIFLTLNPILGVLQLYWFGIILNEVHKVLMSGHS